MMSGVMIIFLYIRCVHYYLMTVLLTNISIMCSFLTCKGYCLIGSKEYRK